MCQEGSELTSQGEPPSLQWGPPEAGLESQIPEEDSFFSHHHWLLLKLALKTGNVSKINAVFGEDHPGLFRPPAWGVSPHDEQQRRPPFPQQELPSSPHDSLASETGSEFQSVLKAEADLSETSSYVSCASRNYDKAPVPKPSALQREGGPEQGAGAVLGVQERGAGGQLSGGEGQGDSTLYFSATAEGATPSHPAGGRGSGSPAPPAAPPPAAKPFPATMAGISPIPHRGAVGRLRPGAGCPRRPLAGSECGGQREPTQDLSHPAADGTPTSWPRASPGPAEEPCLTSTPKSESTLSDCSWKERPRTETSFFI